MISNSVVNFKKNCFLFILAGLLLLLTVFFIPKEASAQAFVPVKDQELIDEFRNLNNALLDSLGGGTYIDPITGNPVAITTQDCSTTTLPGGVNSDGNWASGKGTKKYFNFNNEAGAYKEDWVFSDHDSDGDKEWKKIIVKQGGDVYYTRSQPRDLISGPSSPEPIEDPRDPDYYTNPTNPYFFLPNPDEMSPTHVGINN